MHKKNLLKAALAALLAVHLAKTVARNVDWRDELSIFKVRDMIRIYKHSILFIYYSRIM